MFIPDNKNFQTPPAVADEMARMAFNAFKIKVSESAIGSHFKFPPLVLEPTPGKGNLVESLSNFGFKVFYPGPGVDFWDFYHSPHQYDAVVMNPPFNPVSEMLRLVDRAMELSDNVIALLSWSFVVNSEKRLIALQEFGLVSITNLPRKTFPGCRVQVAIFELKKGYAGKTEFKRFGW